LTPLPGGRTLLQGTSRYRNRMWPVSYWRLWSDAIVHQIHVRVFRHIKRLSEAEHLESQM
jgi:transcription initiation factor IIE alpha subunit